MINGPAVPAPNPLDLRCASTQNRQVNPLILDFASALTGHQPQVTVSRPAVARLAAADFRADLREPEGDTPPGYST
jgi:hypothetical protein